MVFDESLTFRLVIGIILILSAVLLIVLGKNLHLRTIAHTISAIVRRTD
jgi:drug/metabolite transporter (DMT)-like permease